MVREHGDYESTYSPTSTRTDTDVARGDGGDVVITGGIDNEDRAVGTEGGPDSMD